MLDVFQVSVALVSCRMRLLSPAETVADWNKLLELRQL
jgi:hypothetical protein